MPTPRDVDNAIKALPHLVSFAKKGKTTTYKELGDKIGVHHRHVGRFLGYIRDEMCAKRGLPPINVLVVSKGKNLPGDSFIKGGTQNLSEDDYKQMFEKLKNDVFQCNKWDSLLKELSIESIQED